MGEIPFTSAFLGIGSLVYSDLWHNYTKWQNQKFDGAQSLKKKLGGGANWAKNCLKMGFLDFVHSVLGSLVFSDFWQKDEGQCVFSRKIIFVVKYELLFFREMKMVIPKM